MPKGKAMKGKDECTHFGKFDNPPRDADCSKCPDVEECMMKAYKEPWLNHP